MSDSKRYAPQGQRLGESQVSMPTESASSNAMRASQLPPAPAPAPSMLDLAAREIREGGGSTGHADEGGFSYLDSPDEGAFSYVDFPKDAGGFSSEARDDESGGADDPPSRTDFAGVESVQVSDSPEFEMSNEARLQAGQDVVGATGGILTAEALLRELYRKSDEAIVAEAHYMISRGVSESEAAKWSVSARNASKAAIRAWDLDVARLWAEQRNLEKYKDKLGPSYDRLLLGEKPDETPVSTQRSDLEKGVQPKEKAAKTNMEIIQSAGKTDPKVNRWLGRLKIAGRIMIAIDLGLSAYTVASAKTEDRPSVFFQEAGGFMGAIGGGWAGAKVGGAIGGGIGAWAAGAGAVPGAAIGAVVGGVAGAIGGGLLGRATSASLVAALYPTDQTAFEEKSR